MLLVLFRSECFEGTKKRYCQLFRYTIIVLHIDQKILEFRQHSTVPVIK